jgi:large subunit ribosomal protein L13Ae
MFYKAVRGMVPYKTRRGKLALNRLKVFEGIPPPFDKQKRVCVPTAMKILCLRSDRKYCQVGRVAHEVGWQYKDVVNTLEAKRKIKARLHYTHKKRLEKLRVRAEQKISKGLKKQNSILAKNGFITSETAVKAN